MKQVVVSLLFAIFVCVSVHGQAGDSVRSLAIKPEPRAIESNALRQTAQNEKKSVMQAIIYSVLLPGMGELYAGSYNSGKYFTMAEAALWITYFGMDYYSSFQKDNFKAYAQQKGGVKGSGFSDDFYGDVSNYMSTEDFNNEKSFERDFGKMYDPASQYWKWNTQSDRRTYRAMWLSSQHATNNLRFVAGAMLLNRLISAINAARITAQYNKQLQSGTSLLIDIQPNLGPYGGLTANIQLQF